MNFSIYPIEDSKFYNTGTKKIGDNKTNKCLPTQGYNPNNSKVELSSGYNKPLNEVCKYIHYSIATKDPVSNINDSPWNNMTRRISLVKDY
jgi:hypothetical protein